jgi:hypothetical protein
MYRDINQLLSDMHTLQGQLEKHFDETRERFRYSIKDGMVRFSREVQEFQRRFRTGSLRYLLQADLASIITAPVVYAMIVPLLVVDPNFSIYQQICFRAYGLPRVRRRDYLVMDRHRLAYLNTIEILNCGYCSYGNGVIAYAREIISRTKQYWCPIRHAQHVKGAHERYPYCFACGDAGAWQDGLLLVHRQLRNEGVALKVDTVAGAHNDKENP